MDHSAVLHSPMGDESFTVALEGYLEVKSTDENQSPAHDPMLTMDLGHDYLPCDNVEEPEMLWVDNDAMNLFGYGAFDSLLADMTEDNSNDHATYPEMLWLENDAMTLFGDGSVDSLLADMTEENADFHAMYNEDENPELLWPENYAMYILEDGDIGDIDSLLSDMTEENADVDGTSSQNGQPQQGSDSVGPTNQEDNTRIAKDATGTRECPIDLTGEPPEINNHGTVPERSQPPGVCNHAFESQFGSGLLFNAASVNIDPVSSAKDEQWGLVAPTTSDDVQEKRGRVASLDDPTNSSSGHAPCYPGAKRRLERSTERLSKRRKRDAPTDPAKSQHCSIEEQVFVRLEKIHIALEGILEEFRWDKRSHSWVSGYNSEKESVEIGWLFEIGNCLLVSVDIRPDGFGLLVELTWNRDGHVFGGIELDGKRLSVTHGEMQSMHRDPLSRQFSATRRVGKLLPK